MITPGQKLKELIWEHEVGYRSEEEPGFMFIGDFLFDVESIAVKFLAWTAENVKNNGL